MVVGRKWGRSLLSYAMPTDMRPVGLNEIRFYCAADGCWKRRDVIDGVETLEVPEALQDPS